MRIKSCKSPNSLRRVPPGSEYCRAFTLIELVIVIFIISLVLTVTMPSFTLSDRGNVKNTAKQVSGVLRYLYDEAAGKKQELTFTVNLDERSWGYHGEAGSRVYALDEGVEIRTVVLPSHGMVSKGELSLTFGPNGPDEPVILHLQKESAKFTVIFNHLNGRAKILEGFSLGS